MALVECKECGKQISSDAMACPGCGKQQRVAPRATTKAKGGGSGCLAPALLGFGALALIGWLFAPSSDRRRVREEAQAELDRARSSSASSQKEQPTAQNDPVPVATEVIEIDNKKLWSAYHANEVAADNLYKGRTLIVSGTVTRIDKGPLGGIYVGLASPNQFMNTQANLRKSEEGTAATLSKGQKIRVQCRCQGSTMGSPSLRDCTIL